MAPTVFDSFNDAPIFLMHEYSLQFKASLLIETATELRVIAIKILMMTDPVILMKLAPSYPRVSKCSLGESFSVKLKMDSNISSVGYMSF